MVNCFFTRHCGPQTFSINLPMCSFVFPFPRLVHEVKRTIELSRNHQQCLLMIQFRKILCKKNLLGMDERLRVAARLRRTPCTAPRLSSWSRCTFPSAKSNNGVEQRKEKESSIHCQGCSKDPSPWQLNKLHPTDEDDTVLFRAYREGLRCFVNIYCMLRLSGYLFISQRLF